MEKVVGASRGARIVAVPRSGTRRPVGVVFRTGSEPAFVQARDEAGEIAAIGDDGVSEFFPERPVELAGHNTEVTADIDGDGADGAAAHLGGDFLLGGKVGETWVFGVDGGLGFGLGVRGRCLLWGTWPACGGYAAGRYGEVLAAGGALGQCGLEGRGVAQAIDDAGEDGGYVGGAEGCGEAGEARGGCA